MDSCDLSKPRDPTIKLFGRKIEIPTKPKSTEIVNGLTKPDGCSSLLSAKEEHKVSGDPIGVVVKCKSKEEKSEACGIEQDKVFKKPDKILPCPRCNSSDTKFCYFNNYNVNQPRHFCKNCQRYWTAGGTMRNVPVGAGRRKNKQFASQYRQILVSSDGEPMSKIETADSDNNQVVSSVGNGTVLKFGSEAPLCESMDTVLQLGDQKNVTAMTSAVNNREHVHEQELSVRGSSAMVTSGSWSSNVPAKVLRKEQASLPSSCNDVTPQSSLPFYPVLPWSFPLNPGWNSVGAVVTDGGNVNPVQFCLAPMLEIPGRFPPNIPSSNLACTPILGHSSFSAPYGNAVSPIFPTDNSYSLESDGSQTLGKHPRDPTSTEEMQMRKYILVPKMLRINDEDTASKSPIWATFGVIPDQAACLLKNPGFKGLQPESESPHIREANPAALSRSHTFQECT